MRLCSNCQHENPPGVEFCLNCAAALVRACPVCGCPTPVGTSFCGLCGAQVPESASPAVTHRDQMLESLRALMPPPLAQKVSESAGKIVGERRDVTLVSIDATRFAGQAARLDSEAAYLVVDEAMRLFAEVIYQHEGTLARFTGDSLLALFGAPVAHENDPERAVRAALEMQAVLQPLRERVEARHRFEVEVRIAVSTGPVIAGPDAGGDQPADYTVVGEAVNLIARLHAAAEPGTILVSSETYQRTHLLFQYGPLAEVAVRGLAEPIQAAQVLGVLSVPGRAPGLGRPGDAMIGRQAELARMLAALDQVERQRASRVVLVTGEAGLGKSRLVSEFRRSLAPARARLYAAGGLAHVRSRPLWSAAELLRNILNLSETDPAAQQRDALRAYLDYLGLPAGDLLPYLANLLGLASAQPELEQRLRLLEPSMLQAQMHAALRRVLLAEAQHAATVLIFDDLRRVDPASLAFLEYVLPATREAPLLFVLVARDVERRTSLEPLITAAEKDPGRLVDLPLQPLSPDESQRLVRQLLDGTDGQMADLEQRVAARADGNPFFIEEILRMLVEQGGLARVGEAWQVTARAEPLLQAVPSTLKGLILARFDRLPDGPRQRLQKAAVIGRSFPIGLLQRLEAAPPDALRAELEALEASHFLVAEPLGREQGYVFQHALVQEALYGTLLKRDLQRLHEQIAQIVEQTAFWPADEQVEVLAYHYAEGRSPARAVPYLVTAAENAARRYANSAAIQHYRRAVTLMQTVGGGDLAALGRARVGLGRALKFVGQYAEALDVLSQAVEAAQAAEFADEAQRLQLLTEAWRELADVRQREGAWEEAFAYLQTALDTLGAAAAQRHPDLWRPVMDRMAWVCFRQGKLDDALGLALAATAGLDPQHADDPITLASLFNTLGGVYWQQGNLGEAVPYVQRSLRLYEGLGYRAGVANAYTNLGILGYMQGRWAEAAENFERSDRLRREIGYMPGRAANLQNLGLLRMAMGDHGQARRDLETSLALSQQLGEDFDSVHAEIGLAQLAHLLGRLDEAAQHVQAALARREAASEDELIQAGWTWALIQTERGALDAGLEAVLHALKSARAAGLAEAEADCLRVLGLLHARANRSFEAEAQLRASAALAHDHGDRYRQGLALLELGRTYHRWPAGAPSEHSARQAQALAALRLAVDLFEALGAAHDLHQARALQSQIEAEASRSAVPLAGAEPARPALPTGEWHPATVVWVNLDPPPDLDMEALFETLALLMPNLVGIVQANQGHLIRRASGLTVVFGAQVAHEEDAVRAVHTARAILDRLRQPLLDGEAQLSARIAVSAGNVVAGFAGAPSQREFMVTGEPLQIAQQVADAAVPGTVWVTTAVRNAANHQFVFEALPPRVTGLPEALGVWKLEAVREQPGSARGLPGVRLQLVGRETPLEAMLALAQNLRQGTGGLVWIEGEAGIGKSRLMSSFAEKAAPLDAAVWQGNCRPQHSGSGRALIPSLFARLCNLHSTDTTEQIYAKIEQTVQGWPAEAHMARPYLELLLGVPARGPEGERLGRLEPDPLRQQIYVALRTVFKSVAATQPLIVLLDDLHWIDPLSADLLLFLSNLMATAPILFVCALRWEETETTDDRLIKVQSLMRPAQVLRLHLERLTEAEAERLLCDLLADDDLPGGLSDFVLKRSEGNPFFIEEVVRTLIEQDYMHRREGHWYIDLSVNLQDLPLPVSLGALIQSRVDALPPDLRHLLQCAAVVGGTFDESLLSAVATLPQVSAALIRLEARGMLRRTAKVHQWQFSHFLIETAVYNSLLKVRRQALHRQVAEVLEAHWGTATAVHAAELAYHFAQAGAGEQALGYLTLAAEQAASRYANEEALAYFQQAAQLLAGRDAPPASAGLRWRIAVGLGDVYRFVGEYASSRAALEMGLALMDQPSIQPVQQAGLHRRLGETAQRAGEFEVSLRHFDTALSVLASPAGAEAEAEAARIHAGVALTHWRRGRLDLARQAGRASADYARRAGSLSDLATAENLLGGVYYQMSQWDQASAHTRQAMMLREQMGHTWGVATTSANLGILAVLGGDWSEARKAFERSLALRQEIGDVEGLAIVKNNLGMLARDQGELDQAAAYFRSVIDETAPLSMAYHSGNAYTNLGEVLLLLGDSDEAQAQCTAGLEQIEAIGAQDLLCENYRVQAALYMARGAWDEARAAARRSVALAAELGDRSLESAGWRALSEVELQQGDASAAQDTIERAWQVLAGVTSQLEAGRVAAQAGRVRLQLGDLSGGRQHLLEARETFARLGARLDLERVEALAPSN